MRARWTCSLALASLAVGLSATPLNAQQDDPFADPFAADPFAQGDPFAQPAQPAPAPDPMNPFVDPFTPGTDVMSPFIDADPIPDPLAQAPAGAFSDQDNPFFDPTAERAPIPTTELSATGTINPDGISGLLEFRYAVSVAWDGREIVVRRELSREEATAFDTERKDRLRDDIRNGTLIGYDNQTPPDIWVEWVFYYEQLDLWADYVERINLGGDVESPLMSMVRWPGQPDPRFAAMQAAAAQQGGVGGLGGFGGGQFGGGQFGGGQFGGGQFGGGFGEGGFGGFGGEFGGGEAGFNPGFGGGFGDPAFGGMPGGGFGGGFGGQGFSGGAADGPPVTVESIRRNVIDMYDTATGRLRDMEASQEEFMNGLSERLVDRAERRVAYAEWRREQTDSLREFVLDWDRRHRGSVAMVEGRRFELYRPGDVPADSPVNAFVVVTDTMNLTPYDILNPADGTMRTIRD